MAGVVTRRTGVMPQVKIRYYDCTQCNQLIGPFSAVGGMPSRCLSCQNTGPFRINEKKCVYGNYQRLTLQESPGSVPPGRVPRYKDIVIQGDLVDVVRPGEEVDVTGNLRLLTSTHAVMTLRDAKRDVMMLIVF